MSQSYGPFGTFGENYGTYKVLTCPTGSEVYGLTGRAAPNVNKVVSALCCDIVNANTTTTLNSESGPVSNMFGTTNAENPVSIVCNGTDGLTGLHLTSQGELNVMSGKCKPLNGQSGYYSGQWDKHMNWCGQSLLDNEEHDGTLSNLSIIRRLFH